MPSESPSSNKPFRLTPDQLAAATRAREYWATRHEQTPALPEQRSNNPEPPMKSTPDDARRVEGSSAG